MAAVQAVAVAVNHNPSCAVACQPQDCMVGVPPRTVGARRPGGSCGRVCRTLQPSMQLWQVTPCWMATRCRKFCRLLWPLNGRMKESH